MWAANRSKVEELFLVALFITKLPVDLTSSPYHPDNLSTTRLMPVALAQHGLKEKRYVMELHRAVDGLGCDSNKLPDANC